MLISYHRIGHPRSCSGEGGPLSDPSPTLGLTASCGLQGNTEQIELWVWHDFGITRRTLHFAVYHDPLILREMQTPFLRLSTQFDPGSTSHIEHAISSVPGVLQVEDRHGSAFDLPPPSGFDPISVTLFYGRSSWYPSPFLRGFRHLL